MIDLRARQPVTPDGSGQRFVTCWTTGPKDVRSGNLVQQSVISGSQTR